MVARVGLSVSKTLGNEVGIGVTFSVTLIWVVTGTLWVVLNLEVLMIGTTVEDVVDLQIFTGQYLEIEKNESIISFIMTRSLQRGALGQCRSEYYPTSTIHIDLLP